MILELDVGNSSAKWRLMAGGRVIDRGRRHWREAWADLAVKYPDIAVVKVVSVAGQEADLELRSLLRRELGLEPCFAQTQSTTAGLRNSYDNPAAMGADRWLAMLAAWSECGKACLVLDAGSALTLDLVSADGCHKGGYIVAGLYLQQQVLLSATGRVRFEPLPAADLGAGLGGSTQACVAAGALAAVRGAAEQGLQEAIRMMGGAVEVFVTGGDADVVWPAERYPQWRRRPDLVLDGLALALPEAG